VIGGRREVEDGWEAVERKVEEKREWGEVAAEGSSQRRKVAWVAGAGAKPGRSAGCYGRCGEMLASFALLVRLRWRRASWL